MKKEIIILLPLLTLASCSNAQASNVSSSEQSSTQGSEQSSLASKEESLVSSDESQSSVSSFESENKYVYRELKSSSIGTLASSLSARIGMTALADLESEIKKERENATLSPASYVLAIGGLASVSTDFPSASFGFEEDAIEDLCALLSAWNYEYHTVQDYGFEKDEDYCSMEAVVAHQSVGDTYRFDAAKRQSVASDYIATIESSLDSYYQDATAFFHDVLGYSIPVPDARLYTDAVLTYGGFKVKDYVPGGFDVSSRIFNGSAVDALSFGSIYHPYSMPYLMREDCEMFRLHVNHTNLVILLPKVGVDLDDVGIAAAYQDFKDNADYVDAMGYLPYFHIQTNEKDLTCALASKLSGQETLYDGLLPDGAFNDLKLKKVLQNSDFEFNRYGVSGESITVVVAAGEGMPEEHEVITLNVDRPFYAISEKDGFPLFLNKVITL